MSKKGLIIALSLVAIGGATAIYFVLKGEKKKVDPKDPIKIPPPKTKPAQVISNPGTGTPGPGSNLAPVQPPEAFDINKHKGKKPVQDLLENLGKGYYALELVCNKQGSNAPVNCTTKNPISPGLAQGVWIQMKRQAKRFGSEFYPDQLVRTNPNIQQWGAGQIAKFNAKVDQLFPPQYFNQNQTFYKDYLAKGGTPIPA